MKNDKNALSQDDLTRLSAAVIALDSIAAIVQLSDPLKPEHKTKVVETVYRIAQAIEDILDGQDCPCDECRAERENEEDSYSPSLN